MCGIAGFERGNNDQEIAARLMERLERRGPDGGWYVSTTSYGLVQTRLSVIDLSDRVTYPIRNESGDLYLLFNGEIYDYQRHRAMLERRGHRFRTACDAEVVVHGYEEFGTDVFAQLDGMFALALFHEPSKELILARDAVGIKPLVYTVERRFGFASDALALVSSGLSRGAVDDCVLGDYLAYHYVPPPRTGIADLRQLVPGELLRRDASGRISNERWRQKLFSAPWDPAPVPLEEVEDTLDRSVCSQLVADVPVGVFLSSGLDSSLILDSAVRSGARPTAFTISFRGHGDYDESAPAARLAHDLGVPHVVSDLRLGFCDALESICQAYDSPLADASAIATVELSRLARRDVTVALSGTGGDDLFAGYYRHRAHLLLPLLGRVPVSLARHATRSSRGYGADRRTRLSLARSYLARLAATRGMDAHAQYFQLAASASSDRAWTFLNTGLSTQRSLVPDFRAGGGSTLRAIQARELDSYLPGDLLVKEDRATMSVGLEGRVPLLSSAMLTLGERAHDNQKVSLLGGKLLLREIARRRLPSYVTSARKRGFAVPLTDLFAGPWRSDALDWFQSEASSLIDCRAVAKALGSNRIPASDAWALAVLAGWEATVLKARTGSSQARSGR